MDFAIMTNMTTMRVGSVFGYHKLTKLSTCFDDFSRSLFLGVNANSVFFEPIEFTFGRGKVCFAA